jgi:RND family efflux transporter MFP subunit
MQCSAKVRFVIFWGAGVVFYFALACTGEKGASKASLPAAALVKEISETKEAMVEKSEAPSLEATITNPPETHVVDASLAVVTDPTEASGVQRLTGAVSSLRKSSISFHVGGFVQAVLVKPGTTVKKGDVLAQLDDRDFILKLELAKARRDLASVSLDNAKKEYQREQQLKKENASTATSYDRLSTAFEQAKLQLRLAELEVTTAERALQDTKLTAPYDCVIATQMKFEGENVQTSNAIFDVYDVGTPELTFSVPERLMNQLKVGSVLNVVVPSAGFSGKAEIVRLVPVISDRTRTFQIILKINDPQVSVISGSYAEATLN